MSQAQTAQAAPATARWFTPAEPAPEAGILLFLLAHAGSGAAAFRTWRTLLPAEVTAQAVTLPGRQNRRAEPLPTDWEDLVEELYEAVVSALDDRPYALFGHCLGAQLAYRLTVRLEEAGDPPPALVGVSGWAPRGFFRAPTDYDAIADGDVVDWVRNLGAIPAEVAGDPDMLDLVLPPVLADFRLAAGHEDDHAVVDSPLVSYGGQADPLMVAPDAMTSWADRSTSYLSHNEYSGDHFFITRHASTVAGDFTGHLLRQTRSTP